jgi:hypothetical protein
MQAFSFGRSFQVHDIHLFDAVYSAGVPIKDMNADRISLPEKLPIESTESDNF